MGHDLGVLGGRFFPQVTHDRLKFATDAFCELGVCFWRLRSGNGV